MNKHITSSPIAFLYGVVVILSFFFFVYIFTTGDLIGYAYDYPEDDHKWNKESAQLTEAQPHSPPSGVRKMDAFQVIGVSARIHFSGDVAQEINALWKRFYRANVRNNTDHIADPQHVYAVYHQYKDNPFSVMLTLGYRTTADNASVRVQAGDYQQWSGDIEGKSSVLTVWDEQHINPQSHTDFEIWTLDDWMSPRSMDIYIRVQ